jgi:hypothetical protein
MDWNVMGKRGRVVVAGFQKGNRGPKLDFDPSGSKSSPLSSALPNNGPAEGQKPTTQHSQTQSPSPWLPREGGSEEGDKGRQSSPKSIHHNYEASPYGDHLFQPPKGKRDKRDGSYCRKSIGNGAPEEEEGRTFGWKVDF